jgi:hypothetical protein
MVHRGDNILAKFRRPHSFIPKTLLNVYYMPGTVTGVGYTVMKRKAQAHPRSGLRGAERDTNWQGLQLV